MNQMIALVESSRDLARRNQLQAFPDEGAEVPALAPPVPARAPLVSDLGPIPSLRVTAPSAAGSSPSVGDIGLGNEEEQTAAVSSRSPSFTDLGQVPATIGLRIPSENLDLRSEAGHSESSSARSASRGGDVRNRFERRLSRLQQEVLATPGNETTEEKTLRVLTEAVQMAIDRPPEIHAMGPNKYSIEGKEVQVRLMSNGQVRIRNGGAWDPVEKVFPPQRAGGLVAGIRPTATRNSFRPPSNTRIAAAPRRGSAPPPRMNQAVSG